MRTAGHTVAPAKYGLNALPPVCRRTEAAPSRPPRSRKGSGRTAERCRFLHARRNHPLADVALYSLVELISASAAPRE